MQETKFNKLADETPTEKDTTVNDAARAAATDDETGNEPKESSLQKSSTPQGDDLPGPSNPFGSDGGRGVDTSNVQSGSTERKVVAKP